MKPCQHLILSFCLKRNYFYFAFDPCKLQIILFLLEFIRHYYDVVDIFYTNDILPAFLSPYAFAQIVSTW